MPEDMIPLKRFFEAVEERLSACSADELRSILRAMAQVVAPKDRQGFLEALVPSKEARDVIQSALRQDDLLSEIDDLVAEIRAEMDSAEDAYDRYGDHWDDEDSLGPYEQFIAPLAELFDRTAGVFDCGNRSLARDAYRKLFDGLTMEDDYGRGVRASDLRDTDIRGARGRYLRALYETESPANRPERLFEEMQDFGDLLWDEPVVLEDLIRVSDRPLPDREPFLRAWIAFLREQEGPRPTAGSGRRSACWRGPRASQPSPARRGRHTRGPTWTGSPPCNPRGKPPRSSRRRASAPGVAGRSADPRRHRRPSL